MFPEPRNRPSPGHPVHVGTATRGRVGGCSPLKDDAPGGEKGDEKKMRVATHVAVNRSGML